MPSPGIYFERAVSVTSDRPSESLDRRLMSSPEGFQNIVFAVERLAMAMKT